MKRAVLAILLMGAVVVAAGPTGAAPNKSLQNLKGAVSYQIPGGAPRAIAQRASITLADNDVAVTGANSVAALDLPDTSRVLIGQNAKVQLAFFNQAKIAHAKFILYNGNIRFTVEHPKGARANYVFQTQTAQVAVRGTVGDIESSPTQLQVNVYSLGDPTLPVQVTLANGQIITLQAGQAFLAHIAGGVIVSSQVLNVSKLLSQPFTEFNSLNSLHTISLIQAALTHPLVAIPVVAGGAVIVNSIINSPAPNSPSPTSVIPTPTPTPVPAGVIIQNATPLPHAPGTPPPAPHPPAPPGPPSGPPQPHRTPTP